MIDEMLKRHMLSKSEFNQIISNQNNMSKDEYIDWALEKDSPRGITWEATATMLIKYDAKINTKGYEFKNNQEWYDHMWITAKKMNDWEAEDIIYSIHDTDYDDLSDSDKERLNPVIERQIDYWKEQNRLAQREIVRLKKKLAFLNEYAEREETERQLAYHLESAKICRARLKEFKPKGSPSIDEVINRNGVLYLLADDLVDEMKSGLHEWACDDNMKLFRWACHKYTINGKRFTAKQMQTSYNTAKSRPSQLDE